ncbi:MAG: acyl-CoA thioesterase-2 [Polyangiales bacterium]|jgi:acyl-CoA thioesterase-2
MSQILDELVSLLKLERSDDNTFVGQSQNLGWGRVFGGQVLGQALSAASQTVPADRVVHSFHGYFLRPGDVNKEIRFEVDRIRDGRSFTTRRVVASQVRSSGKDEAIFSLSASFQIQEEGFDHQPTMPDAPGPEGLYSERELSKTYLAKLPEDVLTKIPLALRERAIAERPIELRLTMPIDPMRPKKREPANQVWFRANGELPDDPAIHRYLLAYASDFYLLGTSMLPHGATWMTPGMQVASLDHSMYFHRPFRFDEWLLYDMKGPTAVGARGLAHGSWYDQNGILVASTVQEGLIRRRPKS